MTAHHLDDVVETVALNFKRGTGWRGLAVFARTDIYRPLLQTTKEQIYRYALEHRLEWVEDSTNATEAYLRNRLRHKIAEHIDPSVRQQIMRLRALQLTLRHDINRELARVAALHGESRHFLVQIGEEEAIELLGYAVECSVGVRQLQAQLARALLAVKTARPKTIYQIGGGVELHFSSQKYWVSVR